MLCCVSENAPETNACDAMMAAAVAMTMSGSWNPSGASLKNGLSAADGSRSRRKPWIANFDTLERAEDRDGRRDHAVAVEQRRAEQPERNEHPPAALVLITTFGLEHEGEQRQHTAFTLVVRPHDEVDVLHRDDD